jgi:hypothetical protein
LTWDRETGNLAWETGNLASKQVEEGDVWERYDENIAEVP